MTVPSVSYRPCSHEGKRRALFLDRDGVINIDHGYVYEPERFDFVEGIFTACRSAIECGYHIFVITNQAGIGRGYYTEQQFHEVSDWMRRQFLDRGVELAGIYFCPFHPEHGVGEYKQESSFRKPGPGMILQAACEHDLDLAASILVGDKETDIEAGVAAGVGLNILYRPQGAGQPSGKGAVVVASLAELGEYFAAGTKA